MNAIILSHPHRNQRSIQVFGSYDGPDDRYVFGVEEFAPTELDRAEAHARRMMEKHGADHFKRIRREN